MIECIEIVIVMDIVSTKKSNIIATKETNTIATNITSTDSINCNSKKNNRLLYFAKSFISDHITIDNYYYLLSLYKTKNVQCKMENNEFKKFVLKIARLIISMT